MDGGPVRKDAAIVPTVNACMNQLQTTAAAVGGVDHVRLVYSLMSLWRNLSGRLPSLGRTWQREYNQSQQLVHRVIRMKSPPGRLKSIEAQLR